MPVRKILHLDLDAFFCAVEEQRDPTLRGKPFAVGGKPEERGVVASCSYPARQFGVHSAMPMSQAVRLCTNLMIVPARHKAYREVSERVMAVLHDFTPLVEQLSIDEAFLDVSDHPDSIEALAQQLQKRINTELKLSCSLGAGSNKLVAKIANNIGKASKGKGAPPNAITVVPDGQEAEFLASLPVRELWGVGPKTEEKLAALGLHTIGDIAGYDEATLVHEFGKHGADLAQRSRGIDHRPVETERETKSISRETTFVHDVRDGDKLREILKELAADVADALKENTLKGRTIQLKLRWSNFITITRQITLDHSTDQEQIIYKVSVSLLEQNRAPGQAVRLIGVGVSGFDDPSSTETPFEQLSLFDQPADPALRDVVAKIRERFGASSIRRARKPD